MGMITIQQDVSGLRPPPINPLPIPKSVGGSVEAGPDFMTVTTELTTGAMAWNDWSVGEPAGFSSLVVAPSVLEYEDGVVSRVSGAGGQLKWIANNGCSWTTYFNFSYTGSGTSSSVAGWVEDSHPQLAYDLISPSLTEGASASIFSSVNHAASAYPLNASCWAASWDFSGVSVWTSETSDFRKCATLITRRHIWMAWHYRLSAGATVRFRGSDGVVRTYTVQAITPGYSTVFGGHACNSVYDICIGLLNEDVHESIAHYPIVGDWHFNISNLPTENPDVDESSPWQSYIQGGTAGEFLGQWIDGLAQASGCGLFLNQHRQVSFFATAQASSTPRSTSLECEFYEETLPISLNWFHINVGKSREIPGQRLPAFLDDKMEWVLDVVAGDSGSPVFYPTAADSLAIITVLSTSDAGGVPAHEGKLNALIAVTDAQAGISTGYTIIVAADPTA